MGVNPVCHSVSHKVLVRGSLLPLPVCLSELPASLASASRTSMFSSSFKWPLAESKHAGKEKRKEHGVLLVLPWATRELV